MSERGRSLRGDRPGTPAAKVAGCGTPVRCGITLDSLSNADVEDLVVLEGLCFTSPWSRRSVESELSRGGNIAARDARGMLVGYTFYLAVLDEIQVLNVAVAPEHRNRGIATAMLEELISRSRLLGIRTVALEVRPSNVAAIRLYEKLGFRKVGVRPGYYSNGEDGVLMTLLVEQGPAEV